MSTGTHAHVDHSRSAFTGGTTRRAAPWQSPTVRRGAVDVAAVAVLLTLGAIGLVPVFDCHHGHLAALGAVFLGVGIGVFAGWRKRSRLGPLLAIRRANL